MDRIYMHIRWLLMGGRININQLHNSTIMQRLGIVFCRQGLDSERECHVPRDAMPIACAHYKREIRDIVPARDHGINVRMNLPGTSSSLCLNGKIVIAPRKFHFE